MRPFARIMIATVALAALIAPAVAHSLTVLGGPCSYVDYEGSCIVTAASADGTAVFKFQGLVDGGTMELAGNTSSEGGEVGSVIPCQIRFITQGTCTPCLFSIGSCGEAAWDAYRAWAEKSESSGGCSLVRGK
jgi:hypothetical protein